MNNVKLNAPYIANDAAELQDIAWLLSEWTKAQTNSPSLAGSHHDSIRERFSKIAGELQCIQMDLAVTG